MTTTAGRVDRRASFGASTLVIGRRNLLRFVRTPQLFVLGTIQGAMFLLIFRYVFGGAIGVAGVDYVDYLVPGYLTTGVLFTGMGAATGIAEDMEQGFVDRLRSLPIPRSSVLAGRAVADTTMVVWGLIVMTAIGFLVGFSVSGSIGEAMLAFGLVVAYGFAFVWMFLALGMFAGNAQAAQGLALMVFPLTFVSSAYVPVGTMPSWIRTIAEHQPMTLMVDAVRSLTLGPVADRMLAHGASWYATRSLAWGAVIVAVFAPLAVARFRRG